MPGRFKLEMNFWAHFLPHDHSSDWRTLLFRENQRAISETECRAKEFTGHGSFASTVLVVKLRRAQLMVNHQVVRLVHIFKLSL